MEEVPPPVSSSPPPPQPPKESLVQRYKVAWRLLLISNLALGVRWCVQFGVLCAYVLIGLWVLRRGSQAVDSLFWATVNELVGGKEYDSQLRKHFPFKRSIENPNRKKDSKAFLHVCVCVCVLAS
ncbi:hypothetical protein CsSME_00022794 [Camellia sinensis var. sinensis]